MNASWFFFQKIQKYHFALQKVFDLQKLCLVNCCSDHLNNAGIIVFNCVFLFSTQNQVLQIVIGIILAINHNMALSIVIRTT